MTLDTFSTPFLRPNAQTEIPTTTETDMKMRLSKGDDNISVNTEETA